MSMQTKYGTIETQAYCDAVAAQADLYNANRLCAEQIQETLGGIANLYIGLAISEKKGAINMQASPFASERFSEQDIQRVIKNSTGLTGLDSILVYFTMQQVFDDMFSQRNKQGCVNFDPLGRFKQIQDEDFPYLLTYEDCAAKDYTLFLH